MDQKVNNFSSSPSRVHMICSNFKRYKSDQYWVNHEKFASKAVQHISKTQTSFDQKKIQTLKILCTDTDYMST